MPEDRSSDASPYEQLARGALLEITPAATVGAYAGQVDEGDGAFSVLFDSAMPGYPDWKWTVSIAHVTGEDPSVLEAELMPAEGALLAPDWVPWSDRLAEYKAAQAAEGVTDDEDSADESAAPDDEADGDDESDDDLDDDHDDDDDDDDDEDDDHELDDHILDDDDVLGSDVLHGGDLDGVDIDDEDESDDDESDDDDDDEDGFEVDPGDDEDDDDEGDKSY
jgi:hypothetical protein